AAQATRFGGEIRRAAGPVAGPLLVPDEQRQERVGRRLGTTGGEDPVVGVCHRRTGSRPRCGELATRAVPGFASLAEAPVALLPVGARQPDRAGDELLVWQGDEQPHPGAALETELGEEDIGATGAAGDGEIAATDAPSIQHLRHRGTHRLLLAFREAGRWPIVPIDHVPAAARHPREATPGTGLRAGIRV